MEALGIRYNLHEIYSTQTSKPESLSSSLEEGKIFSKVLSNVYSIIYVEVLLWLYL